MAGDPGRLAWGLSFCESPACIVRALESYAAVHGVDALLEALGDPRVSTKLAAMCIGSSMIESELERVPRDSPLYERTSEIAAAISRLSCRDLPPPPDSVVEMAREKMRVLLTGCRTLDCVLVKIASFISWLRPYAVHGGWSIVRALERVAEDPVVRRLLGGPYLPPPSEVIRSDPRHRSLRHIAEDIDRILGAEEWNEEKLRRLTMQAQEVEAEGEAAVPESVRRALDAAGPPVWDPGPGPSEAELAALVEKYSRRRRSLASKVVSCLIVCGSIILLLALVSAG